MAVPRNVLLASIASALTIVGAVVLFYAAGEPFVLVLAFFVVPAIWMALVLARVIPARQRVVGAAITTALAVLAVVAFYAYKDPMMLVFGILLILATWGGLSVAGIVRIMKARIA